MIKAVFIDIDDTLLDFDAYVKWAMKSGFEKFALKPYEEGMFKVFEEINNSLWDRIEKGTLDFKGLERIRFNRIFEKLGIDFDGEVFEKYFRECIWDSAIEVEGAKRMLDYLSNKYILCVASNGPYEQQKHRLELGGMLKYFDFVFISEKFGVSKPEAGFFEKAFEELNAGISEPISPAECVMLGDSLRSDIAGGKNFGMKTVWFNRRKIKTTHSADYEITELEGIEDIL